MLLRRLMGGSQGLRSSGKLGIPRQTLQSKIRRLGIDKYGKKPLGSK